MNNINISVFGYEKQEPYPVYISKEKFSDMLNLLLIIKGKEQHYVLIKDFNKFMCTTRQNTKKENISVCTVCSVSVMKQPSLIIKKNVLQLI